MKVIIGQDEWQDIQATYKELSDPALFEALKKWINSTSDRDEISIQVSIVGEIEWFIETYKDEIFTEQDNSLQTEEA